MSTWCLLALLLFTLKGPRNLIQVENGLVLYEMLAENTPEHMGLRHK